MQVKLWRSRLARGRYGRSETGERILTQGALRPAGVDPPIRKSVDLPWGRRLDVVLSHLLRFFILEPVQISWLPARGALTTEKPWRYSLTITKSWHKRASDLRRDICPSLDSASRAVRLPRLLRNLRWWVLNRSLTLQPRRSKTRFVYCWWSRGGSNP